MTTTQQCETRKRAAAALQGHYPEHRKAPQIVDSLSVGLTHLRDLLMVRAHDDVERRYGADSMMGISWAEIQRQSRNAKIEIEAYSCIVVNDEVAESGYIKDADRWLLEWIFRLRLGDRYRTIVDQRVDHYRSRTIEERRLKFVSLLQHAVPQSAKAPLALFRLFPRSVRIVASVAFGDPLRAQELRSEQLRFLPSIGDCHDCHGRVLDNDEICRCCGNPLWKYEWLLSD